MRYRIVKRIIKGKKTIGYQLLSEGRMVSNVTKENTLELASKGLIVNAGYNKNTNSLVGKNKFDLRSLEAIQWVDSDNSNRNIVDTYNKRGLTNHMLAKEFEKKLKSQGVDIDLEYLSDDRVSLLKCYGIQGKLIIPGFITDFWYPDSKDGIVLDYGEPLIDPNINEVYIDNDPDRELSISSLFYKNRSEHIKLVVKHPEKIVDTSNLFLLCSNAKSIDISTLDTRNVKNMSGMFSFCESLEIIDVRHFNTDNVRDTTSMFSYCKKLVSLDLSNFNTRNVQQMGFMFNGCKHLRDLNIKNFDTRNVKYMVRMFRDCQNLKNLDISSFDISSIKENGLLEMFLNCNRSEIKGLSKFSKQQLEVMFKKSILSNR